MKLKVIRKLTPGSQYYIEVQTNDIISRAWVVLKIIKQRLTSDNLLYNNIVITKNYPIDKFENRIIKQLDGLCSEFEIEVRERSLEIIPEETIELKLK